MFVAGHANALGQGDVRLTGGTLRADAPVRVRGAWAQESGAVLDLTLRGHHGPVLTVSGRVRLDRGAVLSLRLDADRPLLPRGRRSR